MLNDLKFSRDLNLLFLSIFLFAIAMGMNMVGFPSILSQNSVRPSLVGMSWSIDIVGGIVASFFLSRLVKKVGILKSLKISSSIYALSILAIYFYQNFFLWISIAFLMGVCWFTYVITRQSVLNILIEETQRSVALGIFSLVIAVGIGIGPVIAKITGATNYLTFIISASFTIISYLCLSSLKHLSNIDLDANKIRLKEFFKDNPHNFLARFFCDFQTFLLLTLSVIYGKKLGLSYEKSGILISAFAFSGFFDIVVGFLLKKINPYKIIQTGYFTGLISFSLAIFFDLPYILLILVYFFYGCSIACIFVSSFHITNSQYEKGKLVAANSTFQLIGASGSILGALIGGYFIDIFDSNGLPIAIVLAASIYLIFSLIYDSKEK